MEETAINRNGVKIRRCCASCRHREIKDDGTRLCAKMFLLVKPLFCCSQWAMSAERNNIKVT